MSRGVLLWLLAHGAIVWEAGLALVITAGLALAARRARRAVSREAEVLRRGLGEPLRADEDLRDGEVATVAARLEISGGLGDHGSIAAAEMVYEPVVRRGGPLFESMAQARAERLVLIRGQERIEIAGPVTIVVGSRERRRVRRVGRDASLFRGELEPRKEPANAFAVDLRSLGAGDPVWVSGLIQRGAAESSGAYRDGPVRWRILPAVGGAKVKIAFAGIPRVRSLRALASHALHAVLGAALFLLSFGIAGEIAHRRLLTEDARVETAEARRLLGAAAVLAITPFRGRDAGSDLEDAITRRDRENPELLEMLGALYEGRGERSRVAALWIDRGQLDRGAGAAEAAGLDDLAALTWYSAGDFERASRAWERAINDRERRDMVDRWFLTSAERHRFGARVHLLAGRLELAGEEARQLAAAIRGPWPSKDRLRYDDRAGRARCLADALDARRGEATARERIARERSGKSLLACTLLLADLLTGAERLSVIESRGAPVPDGPDVPARWLTLLASEADREVSEAPETAALDAPAEVFLRPISALRFALPAVERALAEGSAARSPTALRSRARASAASAAFASVAGDHEVARRFAEAADDAVRTLARDELPADLDRSRVADLGAVVALAAGDVGPSERRARAISGPMPPLLESVLTAHRAGDYRGMVQVADLFHLAEHEDIGRALLTVDHDGLRLGAFLRNTELRIGLGTWSLTEISRTLRILAPSIDRDRGDPLRWMRYGRRATPVDCGPLCQLAEWRGLADGASALGDAALAAELGARAERFYRALLRRDIAVPLAVLEAL